MDTTSQAIKADDLEKPGHSEKCTDVQFLRSVRVHRDDLKPFNLLKLHIDAENSWDAFHWLIQAGQEKLANQQAQVNPSPLTANVGN